LIPLLIAFMGGIVAGTRMPGHDGFAVIFSAVSTGLIFLNLIRRSNAILSPLILFFALGYLNIQFWMAPPFPSNHIIRFTDGNRFVITGTIQEPPLTTGHRTKLVLRTEALAEKTAVHPVTGRIRVTVLGERPDLSTGDRIRFSAKIRSIRSFHNPGGFDYQRYMGFRRIHGTAWVPGERLAIVRSGGRQAGTYRFGRFRETISRLIETGADGETRAVLKALILGDRSEISPSLRHAFNRAGIGHLLAISGLHIGIVAAMAFMVFRWILSRFSFFLWRAWTRKGAALLSLVPVLIYGLLSGMSPSTQRAVIMVALFMMTFLFEREHDLINTLALAALLIVVIFPPSVFSVSFQLSFTAVLAIVYGLSKITVPAVGDSGFSSRIMRKTATFFGVSLFAIVGTLPPVMVYFNQVSLVGLLTNFIFVPLVGFGIVPLGLTAVLIQPLIPAFAVLIIRIIAHVMAPLLDWIYFFADLPYAAVKTITPNAVEICCFYGLAWAVLTIAGDFKARTSGNRTGRRVSNRFTAKLVCVLAIFVLAMDAGYWTYQRFFSPQLKVTMIDVGQGASSLLELPGGKTFLVDGGGFSDNSAFDMGARVIAPFLWRKKIRTVDTVVLTHPNSDHLNGLLYILDQFHVKTVWTNNESAETGGYKKFREIIEKKGIRLPHFPEMPRERKINGVTFRILNPPADFLNRREQEPWRDRNNNSLVIKVGYGSVSFLFTGDITAEAESELVKQAGKELKSTVLMAPHHGSRTSSTMIFLNTVNPEIIAVSAGWKNRYRFPHPRVLRRYRRQGSRVFRTDRHGAVTFLTNGHKLRVRTEIGTDGHRSADFGGITGKSGNRSDLGRIDGEFRGHAGYGLDFGLNGVPFLAVQPSVPVFEMVPGADD